MGVSPALAGVAIVTSMDDAAFARQFRRRRLWVRGCFLLGLALVVAAKATPEPSLNETARTMGFVLGFVLLGMTVPFYFRYANRCPRCRQSFPEVREHFGSEARGLPLFNAVRTCPTCGLDLQVPRSE